MDLGNLCSFIICVNELIGAALGPLLAGLISNKSVSIMHNAYRTVMYSLNDACLNFLELGHCFLSTDGLFLTVFSSKYNYYNYI